MRILARVSHQGQSTGNAQHTGRIDTSKLFLRQKFNLSLANRVESIDTKPDSANDRSFPNFFEHAFINWQFYCLPIAELGGTMPSFRAFRL